MNFLGGVKSFVQSELQNSTMRNGNRGRIGNSNV